MITAVSFTTSIERSNRSRKGAKAQRKNRNNFASLRLCGKLFTFLLEYALLHCCPKGNLHHASSSLASPDHRRFPCRACSRAETQHHGKGYFQLRMDRRSADLA